MTTYEVWKPEGENVLRFVGKSDARSPEKAAEEVIEGSGLYESGASENGQEDRYRVFAESNVTEVFAAPENTPRLRIRSTRTPRARTQKPKSEAAQETVSA